MYLGFWRVPLEKLQLLKINRSGYITVSACAHVCKRLCLVCIRTSAGYSACTYMLIGQSVLCCECESIRSYSVCGSLFVHTHKCVCACDYAWHVYIISNYYVTQMTSWNRWEIELNQWDSAYFRQLQRRRRRNVCYREADDNLNSTGLHWGRSTKGQRSHAIHSSYIFWMKSHVLSFILTL